MKKSTSFLFCFLFIFISTAWGQHTDVWVLDDFSKLLQSHVSPYLLPKNAATEARNVKANVLFGSLSKRDEMLDYGTIGAYAVTSLHRYYISDGTDILLATGDTYIFSGDDDTGAFTVLRDELTTGLRWSWVTYKDMAIGCNGTDNNQKYDGHTKTTANTDGARTANILTSDLGAPFAELDTGTDLDASSWYQYKIAFYNGTTYSHITARSNPLLTGAAVYNIALTDIPLGPSGTTYRYIYRTLGGANRTTVEADTTFYLVGTLSNNTATTFADDVTDATAAGDAAPDWDTASAGSNVTPPVVKFFTIHKERLFGGNSPSYNSYLFWSLPFKPDVFAISDYEYVRPDDGDEITGVFELLGKLALFKTNSITNFETQNSDDTKWQMYTFSFIGCPAPYSIAKSPLGIIYLGWDGIYVYNGETSQLISDVVTQEIRDILVANISETTGVFFQNEYQLAYTSTESGAADNDVVLVFDTVRDAYVVEDKSINCFEVFDSGSDYGTLYSGSSTVDGKVVAHFPSLSDLIIKYRSDVDAGTKDSLTVGGTEREPEISLGWGIVINDSSMNGIYINAATYSSATINRKSTTGYWWSPAIQVNATDYDKLYWNESLGAYGDITFNVRSASTSSDATDDSLTWSSDFTDPSGSDLSGLTADDYLQLRATLTTTDIAYSPTIDSLDNFIIRLVYSKVGIGSEGTILSIWKSGYMDFGAPTVAKRITGINVYYASNTGTMKVGYRNASGDVEDSFDIDLSIEPGDDSNDQYFGSAEYKIYKWLPPVDGEIYFEPIGRAWQFSVEENGVVPWSIFKILVKYVTETYYDD